MIIQGGRDVNGKECMVLIISGNMNSRHCGEAETSPADLDALLG